MANSDNQPPPRVWINPRPPRTLEDQLHDGGIWHYDGAPDDIPYVPESEVARVRRRNRILREALERAHSCATLRADGTCGGCFVSEALILGSDESEGQG